MDDTNKTIDFALEESNDNKNEDNLDFKDLNYVEGLLILQKMYDINTDEIVQTLNVKFS